MKSIFTYLLFCYSLIGFSQNTNSINSPQSNLIKLDSIIDTEADWSSSVRRKRYFTYHANGNVASYKYLGFMDNTGWIHSTPQFKSESVFNEDGKLTLEEEYKIDNNSPTTWNKESKEERSYDTNGNLIESISYVTSGGSWYENTKLTYSYNLSGELITKKWYAFNGATWDNSALETFTYVPDGVKTHKYSLYSNGNPSLVSEETYNYLNGKLMEIVEYGDYLGSWILRYETTFTYNSNGDILEERLRNKDTGTWTLYSLDQFTYSTNYPYLLEEKLTYVNDYSKEVYTYYPNNTLKSLVFSVEYQSVWEDVFKEEYAFDFSYAKAQISAPEYKYDYKITNSKYFESDNGNWEEDLNQDFFYSDRAPQGIQKHDVVGVKVYPNPSNGHFLIELEEGSEYQIVILDLSGKTLFSSTRNNGLTDINSKLKPGTYILKCENEVSTRVSKIVVQ